MVHRYDIITDYFKAHFISSSQRIEEINVVSRQTIIILKYFMTKKKFSPCDKEQIMHYNLGSFSFSSFFITRVDFTRVNFLMHKTSTTPTTKVAFMFIPTIFKIFLFSLGYFFLFNFSFFVFSFPFLTSLKRSFSFRVHSFVLSLSFQPQKTKQKYPTCILIIKYLLRICHIYYTKEKSWKFVSQMTISINSENKQPSNPHVIPSQYSKDKYEDILGICIFDHIN